MRARLSSAELNKKEFRIFPGAFLLLALTLGFVGCEQKNSIGDLSRLAGSKTDKGNAGHHFTDLYDLFFSPLRSSASKIFEIGIAAGGSLEMWRDYFPKATIYGIDIDPKTELDSDRIKTFVANQADRAQLKSFIDKFGGQFDMILDDGGHTMDEQQVSIGFLFPYLKPGGFYVIEDVHTSLPEFYPDYGVDADGKNSTLAVIVNFVSTGRFESRYLTPAEMKNLSSNIEFCNLFFRSDPAGMTCILKKAISERPK